MYGDITEDTHCSPVLSKTAIPQIRRRRKQRPPCVFISCFRNCFTPPGDTLATGSRLSHSDRRGPASNHSDPALACPHRQPRMWILVPFSHCHSALVAAFLRSRPLQRSIAPETTRNFDQRRRQCCPIHRCRLAWLWGNSSYPFFCSCFIASCVPGLQ